MGAKKRTYRFDKKSGEMVDVTPDADVAVIEQLEKDTKNVRKGMKPLPPRTGSGGYPYFSWNIGVECPEDEAVMRKTLRDHGLDAEFNRDGDLKIESKPHRERVISALDLYDRNGVKSPKNR